MARILMQRGAFERTVPEYRLEEFKAEGWSVVEDKKEPESKPDKGKAVDKPKKDTDGKAGK